MAGGASKSEPSANGVKRSRHRGVLGRFLPGNPGGPGNPHARATSRLRSALLRAATPSNIEAIVRALIEKAKAGDVQAAREVLNRALGRTAQSVEANGDQEQPMTGEMIVHMIEDYQRQKRSGGPDDEPLPPRRPQPQILDADPAEG